MRGGALGDFIVTLPLIRSLAAEGKRLRLVGNAEVARALAPDLFESIESVDGRRWSGLFSDGVPLPPADGGALVIWRDESVAHRMQLAGWSPVTWQTPHPPADSRAHVAVHLMDGRTFDRGEVLLQAESIVDSGIVVHGGSGSPRKNWPHWAALVEALRRQGSRVTPVSGPADEGWPDAVRGISLKGLAGLLAGARAYFGNDSGVSHLAGALGVPTIAVFGPTRALRWAPLGPNVTTIEPPSRCELCKAAEERAVACRCIEQIRVEDVLEIYNRATPL